MSLRSRGCYEEKKIVIIGQYSRGIDDLLKRPMALGEKRVVLCREDPTIHISSKMEKE